MEAKAKKIPNTMREVVSVPLPLLQKHKEIYPHYPHLVGESIYKKHTAECPVCSGQNNVDFYIKRFRPDIWAEMDDREKKLILTVVDPVTWAEENILVGGKPFKPRVSRYNYPYQAEIIRCTSKRMVVRAGRRIGKTQAIIVKLLHKMFTIDGFRIVIFTPLASQIETIWKMMNDAIDSNPNLKSQVVRSVKTPFHTMELSNGSVIKAFVGGSEAVRSAAADLIYIDEASFVKQDVLDAVIALLMEKPDTELILSSTPRGVRDYFIERTEDPRFVSFHFPANVYSPVWSDEMEQEVRSELTESGYLHEVLAEISSGDERVYKDAYLQMALADYKYPNRPIEDGWIYSLGADWNAEGTGTHIIVLGYNPNMPDGRKYKVWLKDIIDVEEWTQLKAIERIVQLNRIWHPEFIYIDRGFGYTNEELLHKIGLEAEASSEDKRLMKIVKSIYFSEKIEVTDPWLRIKVQQPVKPFMVNQTVKLFEDGYITISKHDTKLYDQLENYIVVRYSANGMPIYGSFNPKIGDHSLDALHLAVLAFVMEASELGRPKPVMDIKTIRKGLGEKQHNDDEDDFVGTVVVEPPGMRKDKEREKREFLEANGLVADDGVIIMPRTAPVRGREHGRVNLFGRREPFRTRSKF